jgi:hypothetical protein
VALTDVPGEGAETLAEARQGQMASQLHPSKYVPRTRQSVGRRCVAVITCSPCCRARRDGGRLPDLDRR